jgi:hypothetical protein
MPNSTVVHNATGDGNAPVITATWRGQLYGNSDVGTTAYDARTGIPTGFLPGPSPLVANDQVGLTVTADGTVVARATKPVADYVPGALRR